MSAQHVTTPAREQTAPREATAEDECQAIAGDVTETANVRRTPSRTMEPGGNGGGDHETDARGSGDRGVVHAAAPGESARGAEWREQQRLKHAGAGKGGKKKRRGGLGRGFDHSRWRRRKVAIQLMYEGERYAGFCSQVARRNRLLHPPTPRSPFSASPQDACRLRASSPCGAHAGEEGRREGTEGFAASVPAGSGVIGVARAPAVPPTADAAPAPA